jgi:peptidoglycan hydrolase-like protein with peptidoglycan-binding domain
LTAQTQAAVRAFQARYGLPVSGLLDRATRAELQGGGRQAGELALVDGVAARRRTCGSGVRQGRRGAETMRTRQHCQLSPGKCPLKSIVA